MDRRHFIAAVGVGAIGAVVLPFKLDAETTKPLKVRIEPTKPIGFHVWKVGSNENPATAADIKQMMDIVDEGYFSGVPVGKWGLVDDGNAGFSLETVFDDLPDVLTLGGVDCRVMPAHHEFVPLGPGPGHLLVYVGDEHRAADIVDMINMQNRLHEIFRSMPDNPDKLVTHHVVEFKWMPFDKRSGDVMPWLRGTDLNRCLVYYNDWSAGGKINWSPWQDFSKQLQQSAGD